MDLDDVSEMGRGVYSRIVRIPLVPSIKGNLALPRVEVQTGLQDRVDRCVAINTNPSRGSILQNTSSARGKLREGRNGMSYLSVGVTTNGRRGRRHHKSASDSRVPGADQDGAGPVL